MKLRELALVAATCAGLALSAEVALAPAGPVVMPAPAHPAGATPDSYRRGEVYTYLTIPEWYLVWSPEEYAKLVERHPSSAFPYIGHLGQFWGFYRAIWDATRPRYAFDADYHTMIWIIGASTTIEYGLKWAYELFVGRLAEATPGAGQTAEDAFNARVAREYVAFIKVDAWYRFDYVRRLRELWTEVPAIGPGMARKWERRYYLTSEFLGKAVYGWLLGQASAATYAPEKPTTAVLLRGFSQAAGAETGDVKVVEARADGTVLALAPRYQAFTGTALRLARADVSFVEIAGNRDAILVSALAPAGATPDGPAPFLRQAILSPPGGQRLIFRTTVAELGPLIRRLAAPPYELEHVFDY